MKQSFSAFEFLFFVLSSVIGRERFQCSLQVGTRIELLKSREMIKKSRVTETDET